MTIHDNTLKTARIAATVCKRCQLSECDERLGECLERFTNTMTFRRLTKQVKEHIRDYGPLTTETIAIDLECEEVKVDLCLAVLEIDEVVENRGRGIWKHKETNEVKR